MVDNTGNIVQIGRIQGSADMDPAAGPTDTSYSLPGYNYYLSKTSPSGKLKWIKYFRSPTFISFFEFVGLKVNSQNEIIVVGNFYGLLDFDLSTSGVDTLRSHFPTYPDYFVSKYDSLGNYIWAFNIGDPTTSNIEAKNVELMANDNILIGANPNGIVDVDPGTNIHISIVGNANLICYDTDGNYVWNNRIITANSYAINTKALQTDLSGNSFLLSVGYYELTVNKFDNVGIALWTKKIGNFSTGDRVDPKSIILDKQTGDIYIAGSFEGTVDFDPGALVVNRTASSNQYQDGFIAKYDQNMNLIWVNNYAGKIVFGNDGLNFINNEIIAVGSITNTVNFGNSVVLTGNSTLSPFCIRIDTNGITQNGFSINGTGNFNTVSNAINNSFVTSGYITANTDMDPSLNSLIINALSTNYFTAVYQTPVTTYLNQSCIPSNVIVFPNPSIGNFAIEQIPNNSEIIITNLISQEVFKTVALNSKINIKLENKGVYLLTVNFEGRKINKMIAIE